MVRFLKIVVVVPVAIALLAFAVANHHFVTVSFDPFPSGDVPAFAIDLQGRHRRAARRSRAEADRLRAEAEVGRARLADPHRG
jgi:hypothetical protein